MLNLTKFLEILNSSAIHSKFSILCTGYFKSVQKYAPLDLKHLNFTIFWFIFHIKSIQTIYVNQKLHTLSCFGTLRGFQICSVFFTHPVYSVSKSYFTDIAVENVNKAFNLRLKFQLYKFAEEIFPFKSC